MKSHMKLMSALQGINILLNERFDMAESATMSLGIIDSGGRALQVQLTLESNREKWFTDHMVCVHCSGTGFVAGVLDEPCDNCAGVGYVYEI